MPNTFTLIASSTVGSGGASSVVFSSIPSTYTDLLLKFSVRTNRNDGILFDNFSITFNSISTGYSTKLIYGLSGSATSTNSGETAFSQFLYATSTQATANTFGNGEVYIPNYAGSNNKSMSIDSVSETNAANGALAGLAAGLMSNTAAITSITLAGVAQSFLQYSNFYLYGIKNS